MGLEFGSAPSSDSHLPGVGVDSIEALYRNRLFANALLGGDSLAAGTVELNVDVEEERHRQVMQTLYPHTDPPEESDEEKLADALDSLSAALRDKNYGAQHKLECEQHKRNDCPQLDVMDQSTVDLLMNFLIANLEDACHDRYMNCIGQLHDWHQTSACEAARQHCDSCPYAHRLMEAQRLHSTCMKYVEKHE